MKPPLKWEFAGGEIENGESEIGCIKREIFEESSLNVNFDPSPSIIVSEEISTGFIQIVFLGITIRKEDLLNIESNWEGVVRKFQFSELEELIKSDNVVPSGKAHLMAWLALGAPNSRNIVRFGDHSSYSLFEEIEKSILNS